MFSCIWEQREAFFIWPFWSRKLTISFPNIVILEISFLLYFLLMHITGILSWLSGKELTCQSRKFRKLGLDPWIGKISWIRIWQPTPVFLPGKFHGQRSLVGYSPWCRKELDMTEHTQTHTQCVTSSMRNQAFCYLSLPFPASTSDFYHFKIVKVYVIYIFSFNKIKFFCYCSKDI